MTTTATSAPTLREVLAKLTQIRAVHGARNPAAIDRAESAMARLCNVAPKRRMTEAEHREAEEEARFGNMYYEPTVPDMDAPLTVEAIALAIYNATPLR